MDVSIIIVNYNTSKMVLECVSSVCRYTPGFLFEIIVVDNCSEEQDKQNLRGNNLFTFIELKENIGFGRANNVAANNASGKYLFLLNPDTLLKNNAVSILYDYMEKNAKCGIAGGNLFHKDGSHAHSYHMWFPSIMSEIDFALGQVFRKILFKGNAQFNTTNTCIKVAMITGADLMIRRNIWLAINGFDNRFFMYCEDADLCFRVRQAGYDIVNVPQAEIIHYEGQSFVENESHCNRVFSGRFLYFKIHYGFIYNLLSNVFNVISIASAVLIYKAIGKKVQASNMLVRLRTYIKLIFKK